MVAVSTRALLKIGNKKNFSRGITIPLDWIRFNKPESIDLYYNGDGLIILVPSNSEKLADKAKKIMALGAEI